MIPKYEQLQQMSDEELIARYDNAARYANVGTAYYLEELNRRRMERDGKRMISLTRAVVWLTAAVCLLTVVVVGITLLD